MKVIKTTERPEERGLVQIGDNIKEFPQKLGRMIVNSRKKAMVVGFSALLIGGAILLNHTLFAATAPPDDYQVAGTGNGEAGADDNEAFFALAVIDRQRVRDEALELAMVVIDAGDSEDAAVQEALATVNRIAAEIEAEANIETLLRARGFEQVLAVISNDIVTITVLSSDGLMPNQLVQIKEVAYEQTGVHPLNIRIVERN